MKIIGINGFKRSGKNTVYDIAQGMLSDVSVGQVGFADSLKCIGLEALGFKRSDDELIKLADSIKEASTISVFYAEPGTQGDPDCVDIDRGVLHDESGREFFQNLGNLARERFGKDFWVDQVLPAKFRVEMEPGFQRGLSKLVLTTSRWVGYDYLFITDLRYENEADRIKALGGVVWEVQRPGIESDGHASEQPLPEELVDWQIVNNGSLDVLRERVAEAVKETLN